MIRVDNVSKSYGAQILFKDMTFNINSRERIGLVGRNGHGKSTLFQLILKNIDPDSGEIIIPRNYKIGYLEQHIKFTQPTVIEEGCLGLPHHEKEAEWKVKKILTGLGFTDDDMNKHPSLFSGGYQIRLNLAKVLVSNPNLLLLDEPNNYLDIVAIRWLEAFLKQWPGEIMLITHDRNFMDSISTHTLLIHRQKARKVVGDTEKIYSQIAQEEEIYEKTRLNEVKKREKTELFITRFRAKARLAGLVQSRVKALEKQKTLEKLDKVEVLDFSFNYAPFEASTMMTLENIDFGYNPDELKLIEDFSMTIRKGDRVCIIGKNGKGKSTLMRIMAGQLKPSTGTVKNHPILKMGYYAQTNTATLTESRMIYEEIMSVSPTFPMEKARAIAGAMMFGGDLSTKKISVLSGGEKSRVLLGKILAAESHMILLDEPTNHLDMESCESLLQATEEFEGAVVLVTHNEMFLHTLATRLVVFDRGKILLFEGSYQDFLDRVGWEDDSKIPAKNLKAEKKNNNNNDKTALKKMKAELVQEKSKVLKPLEHEIKKAERTIELLEVEKKQNQELLIKASSESDVKTIVALSRKNSIIDQQMEMSFKNLENISAKFEVESKRFSERMGDL
ncbi:ABC-F family ATP-binding cassette domain-containing protein [Candidatus Poribacteria bacterium]|nr:ABC-F family ATP-binding cassette domain-containing protein [Candidatus Poribacteria bacterium]